MVSSGMINAINNVPGIASLMPFAALAPEALVGASAVVFLLGGVFSADKRADRIYLWLGLFMLAALFAIMTYPPAPLKPQVFFSHMLVSDGFSQAVKLLLVAATVLVLMISDAWLVRGDNQRFEYLVLMLFSLLGMMLMVSADDLLALYIGLELSSLPGYVLACFSRDSLKSSEAGLKYVVLSSLASGMLLFGISLVYGFAGSTSFESLAALFGNTVPVSKGVLLGLVLVMTGLSFKISAVPFHMWTPDVYEGAPTPVTAHFSNAPKIAALALFVRVLIQPFGSMLHDWQQIVIFLSVLSMMVGAFGALMQNNIKRLLAYSSIGHVGYMLIGLAAGSEEGVSGILIYFTLYIPMSVGAFACVLMMQRNGMACEGLSDLAGLSRTRPRMAFALAVFMFSMAGIPPLAGFFGKLYVFLAAVHAGLFVLAVIGVLTSVVACFYYLKVIKIMYFDEPAESFDNPPATLNFVMGFCMGITVLFFLVPTPLVAWAQAAAAALFNK